jgi:hypothetical protein
MSKKNRYSATEDAREETTADTTAEKSTATSTTPPAVRELALLSSHQQEDNTALWLMFCYNPWR